MSEIPFKSRRNKPCTRTTMSSNRAQTAACCRQTTDRASNWSLAVCEHELYMTDWVPGGHACNTKSNRIRRTWCAFHWRRRVFHLWSSFFTFSNKTRRHRCAAFEACRRANLDEIFRVRNLSTFNFQKAVFDHGWSKKQAPDLFSSSTYQVHARSGGKNEQR